MNRGLVGLKKPSLLGLVGLFIYCSAIGPVLLIGFCYSFFMKHIVLIVFVLSFSVFSFAKRVGPADTTGLTVA